MSTQESPEKREGDHCDHSNYDCIHSSHQTPDHLHCNYILHHYRVNYTWKSCVKSIFQLHNETVNVWTHLIGLMLFLYLLIFTGTELTHLEKSTAYVHLDHQIPQLRSRFSGDVLRSDQTGLELAIEILKERIAKDSGTPYFLNQKQEEIEKNASTNPEGHLHGDRVQNLTTSKEELEALADEAEKILFSREEGLIREPSRWALFFYLITAIICMLFSSLFHLFGCHYSPRVQRIFGRLDFCGIAILIFGSFVSAIYYVTTFGVWRIVYLGSLGVFSLGMITSSLFDWFYDPEFRFGRTMCYVLMGLYGVVPFLHLIYLHGFFNSVLVTPFLSLLAMAMSFLVGVGFFITHFPERCCPGKFDIWFHSHQLWHICVIGGALFQYYLAVSLWRVSGIL